MEETGFSSGNSFHAVWIDPDGGAWAVGGQVQTLPLTDGMMIHKGRSVPAGYVR